MVFSTSRPSSFAQAAAAPKVPAVEVACDQILAGFIQVLGHAPGRGHHHGADVGLGIGMHVVQFQGMGHHGVEEHGGGQGGLAVLAPYVDFFIGVAAGFEPGLADIFDLLVSSGANAHAHVVQYAQRRRLADARRGVFQGEMDDEFG